MMLHRLRSLDVENLEVTPDGVKDFAWPVSWKSQAEFRDHLISTYAAITREKIERENEDGDLLAILAMEFVQEAMRGWFAAVVVSRFSSRGEQVLAPWLNDVGCDDPAMWQPKRDRIDFLRNRFPSSFWRSLLRPAMGLTQNDGMSWIWPQTVDFRSRIISTNALPLIRQHIDAVGEKPALVSLRHWFGEASATLPHNLSALALRPETLAEVLAAVTAAAARNGDELPQTLLGHLENWLNAAAPICRWYLHWLLRQPRLLPARLWTGSGGYIFRRILHVATRRAGGKVWSHDHGSGLGLFKLLDTNLTEFVTTDTFVTFSAKQAEGYRQQFDDRFLLRRNWPAVEAVKMTSRAGAVRQAAPAQSKPRKIMFVANQYRGEKLTITPIEFDLVAADWQARLFARLQSSGYDVQLRAHPDSPSRPPKDFYHSLGVQPATGTFGDALKNADIVVLDYLHTTVLREVLLSGKPVLTFEFGHCPPNAVAADILAQRIRFIPGWYDEKNRAQTDWSKLSGEIEAACGLASHDAFLELLQA